VISILDINGKTQATQDANNLGKLDMSKWTGIVNKMVRNGANSFRRKRTPPSSFYPQCNAISSGVNSIFSGNIPLESIALSNELRRMATCDIDYFGCPGWCYTGALPGPNSPDGTGNKGVIY